MNEHFEKDRLYHQAIAHEYDHVVVRPRETANNLLFGPFRKKVGPGSDMLDLACGTGHMVMRFADLFRSVRAVDHSEAMLAQARQKAAARQWSHVQFTQCDVLDFIRAAQPESYDLVTCVGFLHHILPEQVSDTVAGIAKLLRKNGTLILCEPVKNDRVPARIDAWNRSSWAARIHYSVDAQDPDEEPLEADLLSRSVQATGLQTIQMRRSFEVFPRFDPPSLLDHLAIRVLNLQYGKDGNVLTVAARRI